MRDREKERERERGKNGEEEERRIERAGDGDGDRDCPVGETDRLYFEYREDGTRFWEPVAVSPE